MWPFCLLALQRKRGGFGIAVGQQLVEHCDIFVCVHDDVFLVSVGITICNAQRMRVVTVFAEGMLASKLLGHFVCSVVYHVHKSNAK